MLYYFYFRIGFRKFFIWFLNKWLNKMWNSLIFVGILGLVCFFLVSWMFVFNIRGFSFFFIFCATDNWLLNFVIETLMSFYVSTTISMLLTLLCGLFSPETASLVTVGWVAWWVKPNLCHCTVLLSIHLIIFDGGREKGEQG